MSTHSISTRLGSSAHVLTSTYGDRWPILLMWDSAGEFSLNFPVDLPPAVAIEFAKNLATEATKFAEATRAEAARRTATSAKEAAV